MERVRKKINFTEGTIFFKLLRFVLPIVVTNLLQTFYNAADMMIVSLSNDQNAVGAIGTTGSFVSLVVNIFIGFSVGANVVVAREIGAKRRDKVQNAVHTSLLMAVIFGCICTGIGLIVSRPVLRTMGNRGNLLDLAVRYTYIYFLGVPFLALTNYLMAIFRAKGDSKTPLIVLSLAGLFNVGMNFFFVLVVGLSVEGVAIATALANITSFAVLIIKLRRDQDDTKFSFCCLKIDKTAFFDIIRNGIPAGVQGALFSLSNVLIQSSIVRVNNALVPPNTEYAPIVNGNAAAMNIEVIVYTTMNAVYQGVITVTGQNVGAGKTGRVRRIMYSGLLIAFLIGVMMSGLTFLLKKPLLALYGINGGAEGSLEALAMRAAIIRFQIVILPDCLCGCMDACSGVLRGMGKSLTSTVISLVGACLLRMVWIWTVFATKPTLEVLFLSYPITWAITGLTSFIVINVLLRKMTRTFPSKA